MCWYVYSNIWYIVNALANVQCTCSTYVQINKCLQMHVTCYKFRYMYIHEQYNLHKNNEKRAIHTVNIH